MTKLPTDELSRQSDQILLEAWHRMLSISDLSQAQKMRYTRLREIVIVMSVLTTFFAVLSGLTDSLTPDNQWFITIMMLCTMLVLTILNTTFQWLRKIGILWYFDDPTSPQSNTHAFSRTIYIIVSILISGTISYVYLLQPTLNILFLLPLTIEFVLRFIVLILPIIGAAIIVYARTFASSIWVDYRVQSEILRSQIYKYRIQKGLGRSNEEKIQDKETLASAIKDITESLSHLPNSNITDTFPIKRVVARVRSELSDLDPLGSIDLQDYMLQRVESARNWYKAKLSQDRSNLQYYFILGQIITIFGAILTGYNLTLLVAITAAVTTALSLNADLTMYGRTYGLFHTTYTQLDNKIIDYKSNRASYENAQKTVEFVGEIENILANERESWEKITKQIQGQVEQDIDAVVFEQVAYDDSQESQKETKKDELPEQPHQTEEPEDEDNDQDTDDPNKKLEESA